MNTMQLLLTLLFPQRCVACGKVGRYICHQCRSIIRIIEQNQQVCPVCERPAVDGATHPKCQTRFVLDGLTSFFIYEGPIKKAIKELKYRLVSDLARELVGLMETGFTKRADFILTPVPLHASRLRWRGFNQAEILGKIIAAKLAIKFVPSLLIRKKATRPQVELKGNEREKNIQDAFVVSSKVYHLPSKIIIFDDVWTTGSTLKMCGKVLKQAGAHKVWGMTLAR